MRQPPEEIRARLDASDAELLTTRENLRVAEESLEKAIAERREVEKALEESEARHRWAIDRLRSDLALARDIQRGLLPEAAPDWKDLELRCFSKPASEIGGDFYTYKASNNRRVLLNKYVLAVGDVSGKGVPAALLMATALSIFDASQARPLGPAERLAYLDRAIAPYTKPRRQNCALCYVELVGVNTVRPVLRTANAGCIPPYVRHADGTVEWIVTKGPPLGHGLGAKSGYEEIAKRLSKGDMVILASDGVVESQDQTGELFGFDRLESAIGSAPASSAAAMLDHVKDEVAGFVGDREPHDDMTIVVAKI